MRWPHYQHPAHLGCAFQYLRAQRTRSNGDQWPSLNMFSGVQCPARGELVIEANAIEACIQRWGTDDEATRTYEYLVGDHEPVHVDLADTAHTVAREYSDRTFVRGEAPPPAEPATMFVR